MLAELLAAYLMPALARSSAIPVSSFRFTRALVRIAHNIAYEDAQAQVDAGNPPEYLANLWAAWKALAAARFVEQALQR